MRLCKSVTWVLWAALGAAGAGCGGEFILTAPDVAGLAGQEAPAVIRLQRRTFWRYAPPSREAAIVVRTASGVLRCARTDRRGYAAMPVPLPDAPGRSDATLCHQDTRGDVAAGGVRLYALRPDRPAVLVDLDSLPRGSTEEASAAAAALSRLAERADLLYLTSDYRDASERAHALLAAGGCPDGPVIPYDDPDDAAFRLPGHDDDRPLEPLLRRLPTLAWCLTADASVGRWCRRENLGVLAVGRWSLPAADRPVHRFDSWATVTLPEGP